MKLLLDKNPAEMGKKTPDGILLIGAEVSSWESDVMLMFGLYTHCSCSAYTPMAYVFLQNNRRCSLYTGYHFSMEILSLCFTKSISYNLQSLGY